MASMIMWAETETNGVEDLMIAEKALQFSVSIND
jgi:hypothetical protein